MPWYRVHGVGMTHMKSLGSASKWPKPCQAPHSEGAPGEWCQAMAEFQCDWKMPGGGRCDKWLCKPHALAVGANKHLCAAHQTAYVRWADGVREARKLKAV